MINNRVDRSMVMIDASDNRIILSVVKDRHRVSTRPSVRAVLPYALRSHASERYACHAVDIHPPPTAILRPLEQLRALSSSLLLPCIACSSLSGWLRRQRSAGSITFHDRPNFGWKRDAMGRNRCTAKRRVRWVFVSSPDSASALPLHMNFPPSLILGMAISVVWVINATAERRAGHGVR